MVIDLHFHFGFPLSTTGSWISISDLDLQTFFHLGSQMKHNSNLLESRCDGKVYQFTEKASHKVLSHVGFASSHHLRVPAFSSSSSLFSFAFRRFPSCVDKATLAKLLLYCKEENSLDYYIRF